MTEQDRKRNTRALKLALAITTYMAITLWLCINISWWFATLYVLPIVYVVMVVLIAVAEINDKSKNHKSDER